MGIETTYLKIIKATHLRSINLPQRGQEYTMEKEQSL